MAKQSKNEVTRERAKQLYLTGKYQQKEIAEMVGVVENTIKRWKDKFRWDVLRANMTITKENVLSQLYAQLAEINNNIEKREEGQRFSTSREADAIVKLSAAISKMETETGISEITSVSIGLCEFIRGYDVDEAKRISEHLNAYIEYKMN